MIDKIPNEEIQDDIRDTQQETETLKREELGYRMIGDRLSIMKADFRIQEIEKREAFIVKLVLIMKKRGV